MGGLACKTKIIINGGAVQDRAERLCYQVEETDYDMLTDDQWKTVIKHLNTAEDAMDKATRTFLDALGYDGPLPHSLTSPK